MANFHETRTGRQFFERTLPELVRQVERLAAAVERSTPPGLPPVEMPQDAPSDPHPFEPGAPVVIGDNPHHPDASGIVGDVVAFSAKAGFMGCDLVEVRYTRPSDGSVHVRPFAASLVDRGDRESMLARAERHDDQAAKLRAMADEVSR